jgi:hypothetical protein
MVQSRFVKVLVAESGFTSATISFNKVDIVIFKSLLEHVLINKLVIIKVDLVLVDFDIKVSGSFQDFLVNL